MKWIREAAPGRFTEPVMQFLMRKMKMTYQVLRYSSSYFITFMLTLVYYLVVPEFLSGIDDMNILQYYMQAMGAFSTANPGLAQNLQSSLDQEDAASLHALIAKFNAGASI
jgi:hypothetical protein